MGASPTYDKMGAYGTAPGYRTTIPRFDRAAVPISDSPTSPRTAEIPSHANTQIEIMQRRDRKCTFVAQIDHSPSLVDTEGATELG